MAEGLMLEDAIRPGHVGQVLEVAAGMSPRGWRFTERHPDLVYVEADLPDMAARKRAALERIGRPATHRVVELDALAATGPLSLASVAAGMRSTSGSMPSSRRAAPAAAGWAPTSVPRVSPA